MPGIEQSIETTSAPTNVEDQLRVETAEDPSHRADAHAIDPAALERRDLALTQSDPLAEIPPAPPESMPQLAADTAEPDVLHHTRSLADGTYLPLCCPLPSSDDVTGCSFRIDARPTPSGREC